MAVPNDFPALAPGHYALGFAELTTGIVLDVEYAWWRRDEPKPRFRVFASSEDARAFAQNVIAMHPNVECWLYDASATPLERIEVEGTQTYQTK